MPGEKIPGLYEPVHGSAPDIAGQGIANPIAMILSVGMMFEYSLAMPELNRRVVDAVVATLEKGHRSADLGGENSTWAMTEAILGELAA